jgi:hypothetical protein
MQKVADDLSLHEERFGSCLWVSFDGANWNGTMTQELYRVVQDEAIARNFAYHPFVMELLQVEHELAMDRVAVSKGFKARYDGTRIQGVGVNGIGNLYINVLVQTFCIYIATGLDPWDDRNGVFFIAEGDDFLWGIPVSTSIDIPLYERLLRATGISPKLDIGPLDRSLSKTSAGFCSHFFAVGSDGLRAIPEIERALVKLAHAADPTIPVEDLASAKAMSCLVSNGCVPLLTPMANFLFRTRKPLAEANYVRLELDRHCSYIAYRNALRDEVAFGNLVDSALIPAIAIDLGQTAAQVAVWQKDFVKGYFQAFFDSLHWVLKRPNVSLTTVQDRLIRRHQGLLH